MSKASFIAFVAIAAGVIGFSGAASAFPIVIQPALQAEADSSAIVDVKHRGGGHGKYHGNYHRNYHNNHWKRNYGRRCNGWTNYCRYRYNGYWYSNQWWLGPVIGSAIVAGASNSSRHVQWCKNRYRSYNPRNNTWISSSGKVKQCNSPYN